MRSTSDTLPRWLLAVLLVGCSAQGGPSGPSTCTPGATSSCFCASGATGTQRCNDDMTLSACDCAADATVTDTAVTDMGTLQPDLPVAMDVAPRDVPVARDVVTVMDAGRPPVDSPVGGVCPSGCGYNSDCDPCWRAGETRVGSYCCMSGLCVYSSTTCGASLPDGSTMTMPETTVPDASFDLGG